MEIFYDKDVDPTLFTGKTVALIGYGSQGHAHALNLRDSGVQIVIGLPNGARRAAAAIAAGFTVLDIAEAAEAGDIVMLLAPDEAHAEIYANALAPNMKPGAALAFAHGFAIHFGFIQPRADLDVFMVAPKGAGPMVRAEYQKGVGVLCLIAIAQNATGHAQALALAYGSALGCGRAGMIATSFREECETDLFGEQAVLCGGLSGLILAGYETLTKAGYAPEMAYFECLHEVKLIVDLLYQGGFSAMQKFISNTAEYGAYRAAPRIITAATREAMQNILHDVQSGRFAQDWMAENAAGKPNFLKSRNDLAAHPIEPVGEKLRGLMPWLKEKP